MSIIEGMRSIDPADLWDTTTLSDMKTGEILIYTPVLPSGDVDPSRATRFQGKTQLAGPAGAFPLMFDLPGPTIEEALAGWLEACVLAVGKFEKELETAQLQRRILQGTPPPANAHGRKKQ
jgi:hypothetical protein